MRGTKIILIGLMIALVSSICLLSWVPPVGRDALIHHLEIPKLYLEHGGMYEIPDLEFSYYPMNLDLLYLVPLYFKNDIIPKFIHFIFALLTAVLVYACLKDRTNTRYGLLGALFFISVPVIVKLSTEAYVDLGLTFFSFAAIYYLLKWQKKNFKLRFLIVSGAFAGLGAGTKYNGLVVIVLLALFIIFIHARSTSTQRHFARRSIGQGVLFTLTAVVVCSPWLLRNFVWAGNPVYPLYNSWFNSGGTNVKGAVPAIGPFAIRKLVYHETWYEILLVPLRVFFQGQDGNPRLFDGCLNPFLLILPAFAFLNFKKQPPVLGAQKTVLVAFSVLFLLIAFFSTVMRARYIAPIIPPLVVLSVFGIYEIKAFFARGYIGCGPAKNAGNILAAGLVLIYLSLNIVYIVSLFAYVRPFSFISGDLSRDAYIEQFRPEYAAIQFINIHTPKESRVLAMFIGRRGYYSNRTMCFDYGILKNSVTGAAEPETILLNLEKEGILYLMVRYDLFNDWINNNFNSDEKRLLRDFFACCCRRVFSKNGHGVYKLERRVAPGRIN